MSDEEFEEIMDSLFEKGWIELCERNGEIGFKLTDAGKEAMDQVKVGTVQ